MLVFVPAVVAGLAIARTPVSGDWELIALAIAIALELLSLLVVAVLE